MVLEIAYIQTMLNVQVTMINKVSLDGNDSEMTTLVFTIPELVDIATTYQANNLDETSSFAEGN